MYPTGTVTFLFTDLENSSQLWERDPQALRTDLADHDAILRESVETNKGQLVKSTGDGIHAVFEFPGDAVQASLDMQQRLLAQAWNTSEPFHVRIGLHSGQAQLREGDYYGPVVNRAARVMSAASGGQILISTVTAELVRDEMPADVSLVDLGQHRLRSLDRPERLFQIAHPDLPVDFTPLESVQTTPHNLPTQLTSFIGRKVETEQLRSLLNGSEPAPSVGSSPAKQRLITLIGPGGTGKTRLSLQVAGEMIEQFPDGVWMVELAPLTDPERVVQAAAEVVGVRDQPGRPLSSLLIDHLRTGKALLILDNCEHVIDACANLADILLRGCPKLTIMASSREAMGIAGERPFRVRSLSLPGAAQSLTAEELSQYDAIQLFTTRAAEVRRSFELNSDNAEDILQICHRLDGIPLAIELAAAKVRVLTPGQILSRLDNRFRLLTGGSRTALPRQRTLQALIDWSYDLLTEVECILLRRLSVFLGGWTLEAAEEVTGFDPIDPFEIIELLELLHNKSLISVTEEEFGMRYRMLETVRQYAQEKLVENGEADDLRNRHLAYFIQQMEQGSQAINELSAGDWLERLKADKDNHRAARSWAIENDLEAALRLMSGFAVRIARVFPPMESLQHLDQIIAEADAKNYDDGLISERRRLLGAALATASNLAMISGLDKGLEYADRAIKIARDVGDAHSLATGLLMARVASAYRGDIDQAAEYHQEFESIHDEIDGTYIQAMGLISFGSELRFPTGAGLDGSWPYWERGMAMFRQAGDLWGLGFGHQLAAAARFLEKDMAKSQYHAERSLELYEELGETYSINSPRSRLADLAKHRGELEEAAELYIKAIAGWRDAGQFGAMARCTECLAFTARAQVSSEPGADSFDRLAYSATLLGASEAIRKAYQSHMNYLERKEYEAELALIKESVDKEIFDKAWHRGQAMKPDQLVTFVREANHSSKTG